MKRYCARCDTIHPGPCPNKRNGSTRAWRKTRAQHIAANPHCVDCGTNTKLHLDHITPLAMGGANTASNYAVRCERCNKTKGATIR